MVVLTTVFFLISYLKNVAKKNQEFSWKSYIQTMTAGFEPASYIKVFLG